MHSVISYISADGDDERSVGGAEMCGAPKASTDACGAPSARYADAAAAMPLVVPMADVSTQFLSFTTRIDYSGMNSRRFFIRSQPQTTLSE